MHPIIFDFGAFPLRTYGVMLALGFLCAFIFARLQAKRVGIDSNSIPDLLIWVFVGGILGARLLYVAIHREEFDNPLLVFAIWKGGQVFYGGFIGGFLAGILFARRRKINVLDLADLSMPATLLGLTFGRWGCFMAGCCYGKIVDPGFPLGVAFPRIAHTLIPPVCQNADPAHPTCFLHPIQLYSSANAFILFLIVWFMLRRRTHRGVVTGAALVLYAVTRSIIELWRADTVERVYYFGLSTSQWFSIPILLAGLYLLVSSRRRPVPPVAAEKAKP